MQPGVLAIEADNQVIGVIGVGARLGYWLARAWHGQRLMTEAAEAVVAWHFKFDGGPLASDHFAGNDASRRILLRLGFIDDGSEVVHALPLGRDVVLQKLVLTPKAWAGRPRD